MVWSQLKIQLKSRFAEELQEEIDFYMSEYGNDWSSRAWITINGKEVVHFSTAESYFVHKKPWNELTKDKRWSRHAKVEDSERTTGLLVEKGEFSRYDFTECCYRYLDLNIQEAQSSDHPIIRMFSVLDRRTGKRKLKELSAKETNPLVRYFIEYRATRQKEYNR